MVLHSLLNSITSAENFYKHPKKTKEIEFLQKEFELEYKEAVLFSVILKLYFERKRFRGLDVEDLMEELNIEAASKEHIELIPN